MLKKITILRQLDVLNSFATLSCYPFTLIQTSVSIFCLFCKPFRKETSHLLWYHSSGWIAKPTSIHIISCPLKCHVDDHVPVLFSGIFLMLMHFCLSLIWCNSWQMGWVRVVPLGCMPPALPTQQLEWSLWTRLCSKVLVTELARPCCVLDHIKH